MNRRRGLIDRVMNRLKVGRPGADRRRMSRHVPARALVAWAFQPPETAVPLDDFLRSELVEHAVDVVELAADAGGYRGGVFGPADEHAEH